MKSVPCSIRHQRPILISPPHQRNLVRNQAQPQKPAVTQTHQNTKLSATTASAKGKQKTAPKTATDNPRPTLSKSLQSSVKSGNILRGTNLVANTNPRLVTTTQAKVTALHSSPNTLHASSSSAQDPPLLFSKRRNIEHGRFSKPRSRYRYLCSGEM